MLHKYDGEVYETRLKMQNELADVLESSDFKYQENINLEQVLAAS